MPQPVFILAAPRSFSSVFGTMLGQNPDAYGLPELNIFVGDTLGAAWAYLGRGFPLSHHGLLRVLAQLHEGAQTDDGIARARDWVAARADWPIPRLFDHLQAAVGDRVLVEKGPIVTFNAAHLQRMYRMFPGARYLHLVRHPRSSGASLIGLRDFAAGGGPAERPRSIFDPEQVWAMSNANAAAFVDALPPGQVLRLQGETVMRDPEAELARICDWLGLDSGAAAIGEMLHPERSPYAGLGPDAAPFGNDPNFLRAPALDRARLARIEIPDLEAEIEWRPGERFAPATVALARSFGYR